jgi:spore coat polysaccharide biosynthesis protein SpsF
VKILIICQARSTNKRLPKKNFLKIGNKSIIEHHISGLNKAWFCDKVIATPHNEPMLKQYKKLAKKYGWVVENPNCDENDVLKRFVMVCDKYQPDWVVRTTADCAFMDIDWVQKTIRMAVENNIPIFNSFNEGSTVEVFPAWCLYRADAEVSLPGCSLVDEKKHRQHVTSYFRKGFNKESIDTPEELTRARADHDKRK